MNISKWYLLGGIAIFAGFTSAEADECRNDSVDTGVLACLARDLRESDARINELYQKLLHDLLPASQSKLRKEQRAWIKARDEACDSASIETDRERWYQELQNDYGKMFCVTRYTRARSERLEQMLVDLNAKTEGSDAKSGADRPRPISEYQVVASNTRDTGKWYFEVLQNVGSIARLSPTAIWVGCGEATSKGGMGQLSMIRPDDKHSGFKLVGVALDLDNGKFYTNIAGKWQNGEPGSSGGLDVKLGRPYRCGINSTVLVAPMQKKHLLFVNFGERPFVRQMPAGYAPFQREPLWLMGANENGHRLYVDYRSLNIAGPRPGFVIKGEEVTPQPIDEGDKRLYKTNIMQAEFPCPPLEMHWVAQRFMNIAGVTISQWDGAEGKYQPLPEKSVMGSLARTLCYLREQQFTIPEFGTDERWEEMASPSDAFKIYEAPDSRQYHRGILLIKIKNQFEKETSVFGVQTRVAIGVSAVDCSDVTTVQLMGARNDGAGNLYAVSFAQGEKTPVKLPQNRERYKAACSAMAVLESARSQ